MHDKIYEEDIDNVMFLNPLHDGRVKKNYYNSTHLVCLLREDDSEIFEEVFNGNLFKVNEKKVIVLCDEHFEMYLPSDQIFERNTLKILI